MTATIERTSGATATEPTARATLAGWVREHMAGRSEVALPDVTDAAVSWLMDHPKALRPLLHELVRPLVYTIVQAVAARTRGRTLVAASVEELAALKRPGRERWRAWLEHAGERHVRLHAMTRSDLLAAADAREARGERELAIAAFWRALAAELTGGQTVGERFSTEALAQFAAGRGVSLVDVTEEATAA